MRKPTPKSSGGVWHEGLEQLLQSPDVRAAARDAASTGANKAAAQGFKPPRNPFVWDENGAYTLATDANGNRAIPSLQFWDAVKQNLDDKIGAARRAGEKGHAADLTALNAQLKAHLDAAVPSYADARAGAAAFFGAQDALEAGQKFVTARGENAQYTRALSSMSPPERQLFARGYASELADRVLELRDNQNVVAQQYFNSPAGRDRSVMALGRDKANQLEAWVRAESSADALRTAMGNSTTARQLAEMGLVGASGLVLGEGFIGGDLDKGHYITAALALGAAYGHHRMGAIDKSLATQIGKMLASDDPAVLQRGIAAVAKSGKLMQALRASGDAINALARRGTTTAPIPQVAPPFARGMYPAHSAAAEETQPNNDQRIGAR